MPCGDNTTFPVDSFSLVGRAFVNKDLSLSLFAPACDVACYAEKQIEALIPGPTPVPFPKPTFGAGVEHDEADIEKVGHMLLAMCDEHKNGDGAKMAQNVGAIPWGTILSVLGTVLQGILLALSKNPIPNPIPAPTPPTPAPQ